MPALHDYIKTAADACSLVTGLSWQVLALLAGLVFFKPLYRAVTALAINVEKGAPVTGPAGFGVGQPPLDEAKISEQLTKSAERSGGDLLTDAYIALFHTSFRRPDKDQKYHAKMYQIEVITVGPDAALDEIESVVYHLDPSYPKDQYVIGNDKRNENFKLKELANGYSIVRADVRFKDNQGEIRLNRFINLTDEGPRI